MFRSGALRAPHAPLRLSRLLLLAALLSGALAAPVGSIAKGPHEQTAAVSLAELPPEARTTEIAIRSGGPFTYSKDGAVFGNRERRLPGQARGYYREYTVPTPGAPDRGARRIVCGGAVPTAPDVCYYTSDHYTSFRRIVQ